MATAKDGEPNESAARTALVKCMEHLAELEPEDARRVVRTLVVWAEDPDERANQLESLLETLQDIGRAVRGE